jgi:uncharacterized protein (TIGR02996 family)
MSDRAAFLAAIRAAPADDLPRLVFADWLDERGDPLGEFIRVQIELEPVRDRIDDPHVRDLTHREADLLVRHGEAWAGSAADLEATYPQYGPVFVRGFPERVCVSLDTLLSRGGELFAACPTLREVAVFDVAGRGRELAECPHLAHVETLEIADWLDDEDWHTLVETEGPFRLAQRYRLWLSNENTEARHVGWYGQEGPRGWPACVELVALTNDISVDGPTGVLDADGIAAQMAENLGRPVVRLVKPFDHRFPLFGDLGHGLTSGRNDDGEAVLLAVARDGSGCWVIYNDDGRVEDVSTFGYVGPDEVRAWRRRHAGLIRVREFETLHGALSARLWPRSFVNDYFRNPLDRPPMWDEWEWRNRGGVVRRWLEQGRFVIEWDGREFHADKTGTIFAA